MVENSPAIPYHESRVAAADGTTLFSRRWQPPAGPERAHLCILHGYFEHGGRYRELAHRLALAGIGSTALDLRGHGHSGGQRGYVGQFEDYLDDVQVAMALLPPQVPHFLLGHSHGALVGLDYLVGRAPQLAGVILTNPFLAMATPPPATKAWIARLAATYAPRLSLPSGLSPADVSRDPAVVQAYSRDSLIFRSANASWYREVNMAQRRVRTYRQLAVPLLYVYSDADRIAAPAANAALADRLESPDKTVRLCPQAFHEVLNEPDRATLHAAIASWIGARA